MDQAVADEGSHQFDIRGHARHQFAGLRTVVVGKRKALQFGENGIAQFKSHALRGAFGQVALQEVEHAAPDGDQHQPDRHLPDHRHLERDDAIVDQLSEQARAEQAAGIDDQQTQKRPQRGRPVMAQINKHASKSAHNFPCQ